MMSPISSGTNNASIWGIRNFSPIPTTNTANTSNNQEPTPIAPSQEGNRQSGTDNKNCDTCDSRKYKDGSNDPGVSYKTPTTIGPKQAPSAVRAHENEHVSRERSKAYREDREIVSQSVNLQSSICPECGDSYISGGTTSTTTKAKNSDSPMAMKFQVGLENDTKGKYLDLSA